MPIQSWMHYSSVDIPLNFLGSRKASTTVNKDSSDSRFVFMTVPVMKYTESEKKIHVQKVEKDIKAQKALNSKLKGLINLNPTIHRHKLDPSKVEEIENKGLHGYPMFQSPVTYRNSHASHYCNHHEKSTLGLIISSPGKDSLMLLKGSMMTTPTSQLPTDINVSRRQTGHRLDFGNTLSKLSENFQALKPKYITVPDNENSDSYRASQNETDIKPSRLSLPRKLPYLLTNSAFSTPKNQPFSPQLVPNNKQLDSSPTKTPLIYSASPKKKLPPKPSMLDFLKERKLVPLGGQQDDDLLLDTPEKVIIANRKAEETKKYNNDTTSFGHLKSGEDMPQGNNKGHQEAPKRSGQNVQKTAQQESQHSLMQIPSEVKKPIIKTKAIALGPSLAQLQSLNILPQPPSIVEKGVAFMLMVRYKVF